MNTTSRELLVSKSLEQTKRGGLRVKSTKSGEERRFVLPDWTLEVLGHHRIEQDRDRELFAETLPPRSTAR